MTLETSFYFPVAGPPRWSASPSPSQAPPGSLRLPPPFLPALCLSLLSLFLSFFLLASLLSLSSHRAGRNELCSGGCVTQLPVEDRMERLLLLGCIGSTLQGASLLEAEQCIYFHIFQNVHKRSHVRARSKILRELREPLDGQFPLLLR